MQLVNCTLMRCDFEPGGFYWSSILKQKWYIKYQHPNDIIYIQLWSKYHFSLDLDFHWIFTAVLRAINDKEILTKSSSTKTLMGWLGKQLVTFGMKNCTSI